MLNNIYTREAPANSIGVLLHHLEQDEPSRYLFRGQVRAYPALIPSGFRNAVSKEHLSQATIPVEKGRYHSTLDERGRHKLRQLTLMIRRLGRVLGNILAQQYGVTSEAIDVTDDPRIAAFFATRKWPAYRHFSGSVEEPLGVIYRIRRLMDRPENLAEAEFIFEVALGQFSGIESKVAFTMRRDTSDLEGAGMLGDLDTFFHTFGRRSGVELFTVPGVLDCDTVLSLIKERLGGDLDWKFENTRFVRQRAGLIRPPMHFTCTIAERVICKPSDKFPMLLSAFPPLALTDDIQSIENLSALPLYDAFYFRHSVETINQFSCEYLWPSQHDDNLFDTLVSIAALEFKTNERDDLLDQHKGLFDRGYYET